MEERRKPLHVGYLPGGVRLREAWPSEDEFFLSRRDVSGLAADDNCVVLNPYADLSRAQLDAVALNEAARVVMRRSHIRPTFTLTDEQTAAFKGYGSLEDVRATIAARILSGDPTALTPTLDQIQFVSRLAREMGLSQPRSIS